MQAERRLEAGMRQIKFARDQERTPQLGDRLLGSQMRPLVEPFSDQKLGAGAGGDTLAFNFDLDPHEHLRRCVDDHGAKTERPSETHRALEEFNLPDCYAWRHQTDLNPARFG